MSAWGPTTAVISEFAFAVGAIRRSVACLFVGGVVGLDSGGGVVPPTKAGGVVPPTKAGGVVLPAKAATQFS
jgi:hypothetical protein